MTTFTIKPNQQPTEETIKRLSALRDEDIVYDDDSPEMTPKMQKALFESLLIHNTVRSRDEKLYRHDKRKDP